MIHANGNVNILTLHIPLQTYLVFGHELCPEHNNSIRRHPNLQFMLITQELDHIPQRLITLEFDTIPKRPLNISILREDNK